MAIIGLNCELYVGDAGGTLTSADLYEDVTNVSLNMSRTKVDVTTRASKGWRVYKAGLRTADVDLNIIPEENDAKFEKIYSAYDGRKNLQLFISNGFGKGLKGTFKVFSMTEGQPIGDAVTKDVKLKPTGTKPVWEEDGPSSNSSSEGEGGEQD